MSSLHSTFIVGSREFTCVRMNAFAANKHLMRIQKLVVPVLGSVAGASGVTNPMDMDLSKAAAVISEHLDENLFETLVFPLFADAKVYFPELKIFIKGPTDIDRVFTTDNLFDLYELIFVVVRHQFSPFFASLANRFGVATGALAPEKA